VALLAALILWHVRACRTRETTVGILTAAAIAAVAPGIEFTALKVLIETGERLRATRKELWLARLDLAGWTWCCARRLAPGWAAGACFST
jgi:hypothetical protein